MRAGADKDQLGFSRLVNQQPFGADMAFSVVDVITCQSMISVTLWQKLLRLLCAYDQSQLFEVFFRRKKLFKVLLEPALADELQHQP